MAEIVGVGHCCQDYLCVVREYPPEDGSTRILEIRTQGGGAVATALVAASRLGASAAYIGNLGADAVGDEIIAELVREGVDVSAVERLDGVSSLVSYVMINPSRGTRTKFPLLDRTPPIRWTDRQVEMLRQAKVLHLDGTNFANAHKAATLAKQSGVIVSLDGGTGHADNALNVELASMADILIMSATYPTRVTGLESLEEALIEMGTWGPQIVMATVGARGVYALVDGRVRHFPAKPAQVVDTTGAGDVFHGAFLAAYLRGYELEACIDAAQYAAARKCEQMGGRAGIPRGDQVWEYLTTKRQREVAAGPVPDGPGADE